MIEHEHESDPGSGEWVVRRLILIEADDLGIPESLKIECPVVVRSVPRDHTVPLSIRPVVIENAGEAIDETKLVGKG